VTHRSVADLLHAQPTAVPCMVRWSAGRAAARCVPEGGQQQQQRWQQQQQQQQPQQQPPPPQSATHNVRITASSPFVPSTGSCSAPHRGQALHCCAAHHRPRVWARRERAVRGGGAPVHACMRHPYRAHPGLHEPVARGGGGAV